MVPLPLAEREHVSRREVGEKTEEVIFTSRPHLWGRYGARNLTDGYGNVIEECEAIPECRTRLSGHSVAANQRCRPRIERKTSHSVADVLDYVAREVDGIV